MIFFYLAQFLLNQIVCQQAKLQGVMNVFRLITVLIIFSFILVNCKEQSTKTDKNIENEAEYPEKKPENAKTKAMTTEELLEQICYKTEEIDAWFTPAALTLPPAKNP